MNESPKRLYYRTAGTIEANESEGEEGMSDHRTIQEPTYYALKDYLHYQHPSTKGDVLLNEFCDSLKQIQSQLTASQARVKKLKTDFDNEKKRLIGRILEEQEKCDHKPLHQRIATLEQELIARDLALAGWSSTFCKYASWKANGFSNDTLTEVIKDYEQCLSISTALNEKEGK